MYNNIVPFIFHEKFWTCALKNINVKNTIFPIQSIGMGQGSKNRYTTVLGRVLLNTIVEIETAGADFTILPS